MTTPYATDVHCQMTVALSILRPPPASNAPTLQRRSMTTPFATDIRCHMAVALTIARAADTTPPAERLVTTDAE